MKQVAIYGKGGIGKSTLSAHLSAALARQGRRVLQIGCDPKHDSTRLLTHGRAIPTVLDYLRVTGPLDYRIEDVLFEGFCGIGCVEAGGPTPGVGCAGRGIISTFDLLSQFRIQQQYDLVLYDVLGDVVCGGFAVPIRREYADTVLIVTSGAFMSLYAANNILRGLQNYDQEQPRAAGILYNRGNLPDEDERVAAFARAVGLPILTAFPRSESFVRAEREGRTLIESGGDPKIGALFAMLAEQVAAGLSRYPAAPLDDDALERHVLGRERPPSGSIPAKTAGIADGNGQDEICAQTGSQDTALTNPNRYLSKNLAHREPLHGCAFNGAVSMSLHLTDAVVLAHAPKSCAYLSYQSVSSAGRRGLFERGALLPVALSPNLECTEMRDADMVFGGMELLQQKLTEIRRQTPAAIVIVSACPAGIIGDDIEQFACSGGGGRPPVVALKTDGNLAGDYLQGMLMSYTALARGFIQKDADKVADTVNVVFEKVLAKNTDTNFQTVEGFLNRMGVSVNCRFLCETTVGKLQDFCSAPLNLLAYRDYTGRMLQDFFETEYGCRFLEHAFPVGFAETARWLRAVAAFFGRADTAEQIIAENETAYRREVQALAPKLRGKRLMVITYNHNLDWILRTALDVGIEVVRVGILNFSQDAGFTTELDILPLVVENYDKDNRARDVGQYRPDILLANYEYADVPPGCVADTIPMCPDVGFYSGIAIVRRWAAMFQMGLREEWRQDETLFNKYYA